MTNPLAGLAVSEKLTRSNYLLWQSQVLPPIRGARLTSFLDTKTDAPPETITVEKDGKPSQEANPAYDAWVATDQQVSRWRQSLGLRRITFPPPSTFNVLLGSSPVR
ncbi:hypothetical protein QYE76_056940 [Lolium multiflorum]|uniref:Retrotransposon Copia-like N-terminal domain-containing protein n=1 Tax=Lolium multiflorum TaxID=4521 RepID=A0AAD8T3Z6_LOLMU|nr:hypothetical protein QYE76_056940 [Lolium multiflorum]